MHQNPLKGFVYSLIATLLLATNFITAKYALQGFNPDTFSLIWTGTASVFAFLMILFTNTTSHLLIHQKAQKKIFFVGVLTGLGMILGWAGLARLDPSFASFLRRFQLVVSILLGVVFLSERFLKKELFPIALVIAGGFISVAGRWHVVGAGVILTLLSAVFSATQMFLAKILVYKDKVSPRILTFYRLFIAFMTIAIWNGLIQRTQFQVPARYYLVTFIGAFLGPFLSWIFVYRSYRYWELSRSSVVLMIQPLFVLPLAYFILGRLPASQVFFGGIIILTGGFWLAWIQVSIHKRDKRALINRY